MFCDALQSFDEKLLKHDDLLAHCYIRCPFPMLPFTIPSFVPFHECLLSLEIIGQTK